MEEEDKSYLESGSIISDEGWGSGILGEGGDQPHFQSQTRSSHLLGGYSSPTHGEEFNSGSEENKNENLFMLPSSEEMLNSSNLALLRY